MLIFLIQHLNNTRWFLHTFKGNILTIVTQCTSETHFITRPQMKQNMVHFSASDIPTFHPHLRLFLRLSAPCLPAHACVNRQLATTYPSHLSLYIFLKILLKCACFAREISLTETQRTISWGRLRLPPHTPHPRNAPADWMSEKKRKEEKRERNSSCTILPIGRLCDAHLQPRGSILHVCTVYFGLN